MGYFRSRSEDLESTDSESEVHDIADILRNVDVRTVTSSNSGQGFETSFLMIEGREMQTSDFDDGEEYQIPENASWKGNWLCRPYKRERLHNEILSANRRGIAGHAAVLNTLKNTGVMIFIIDSKVSTTTADVMDSVRNVLHHVCKEERSPSGLSANHSQRCLLYRDHEGRFFNLTLQDHASAQSTTWEEKKESFSVLQALTMLTILCRSFACINDRDTVIEDYRPVYLALLLGLVCSNEISMSWTNVAMSVRGFPSLSACSVVSGVESDWPRKAILFSLLVASVTTGTTKYVLTLGGIGLTCAVLLANVGARAWGFLRWRPIGYWSFMEPVIAFLAAMATGMFVPFLGHRQVESGGKASMENVIGMAVVVGVLFIMSDHDYIQGYLVLGSENCIQDNVNLGVGVWWTLSFLMSMIFLLLKEREGLWPDDEETLLVKDHKSPVGFSVPHMPDFPIDLTMSRRGLEMLNLQMEFCLGVALAFSLGGFMCYLAFSDVDDEFEKIVQDNLFNH